MCTCHNACFRESGDAFDDADPVEARGSFSAGDIFDDEGSLEADGAFGSFGLLVGSSPSESSEQIVISWSRFLLAFLNSLQ